MAVKIWAIVLGVALAFILIFLALAAQGPSTPPSISLSSAPNPTLAQTLQVTISLSFYSFQTPNTIFQSGVNIHYSVWQNANLLTGNQTISPNPVSQSGFVFTVSATFSITTAQLCTASTTCTQTVDNITVSAYSIVKTYPVWWTSSTTKTTFSNAYATTGNPPAGTAAPVAGFYLQLFGFVFGAVIVAALCAYIAVPHKAFLIVGVVGVVGLVVILLLFG
jgi:hypothetical protein